MNLTLFSPLLRTLLQEENFKEIFKTDEGNFVRSEEKYEQNRKFCVVKVETLFQCLCITELYYIYIYLEIGLSSKKGRRNRGDICLRCTKITLAHESFCYFLNFCFFVVRRAKRLKFSIVIHWFLRVKENFWLDVID